MNGYIYLATNPFLVPGIYKIGLTVRPLDLRMRTLSNSSIPGQYTAAHFWLVSNAGLAERLIHSAFADSRVDDDREFFLLPNVEEAIATIATLIRENCLQSDIRPVHLDDRPTQPSYRLPPDARHLIKSLPAVFSVRDLMQKLGVEQKAAEYFCEKFGRYFGQSLSDTDGHNHLFIKTNMLSSTRSFFDALRRLLRDRVLISGIDALRYAKWAQVPRHYITTDSPAPGHLLQRGSVANVHFHDYRTYAVSDERFETMWKLSKPIDDTVRYLSPELALADMLSRAISDFGYNAKQPLTADLLLPCVGDDPQIIERIMEAKNIIGLPESMMQDYLKTIPFMRTPLRLYRRSLRNSADTLPSP